MVEQGYNYLDGPIHSIAEFFKTSIDNLKKLIPQSVPSRNKKMYKKDCKKRVAWTCDYSEINDSDDAHKGKIFCKFHGMCGHTTYRCETLKALIMQAKKKK